MAREEEKERDEEDALRSTDIGEQARNHSHDLLKSELSIGGVTMIVRFNFFHEN